MAYLSLVCTIENLINGTLTGLTDSDAASTVGCMFENKRGTLQGNNKKLRRELCIDEIV